VLLVFSIYRQRLDLFMLAAALGVVMTLFSTWVGRHMIKASEIAGVFGLGCLVIGQVAATAAYLRKIGRGHEAES
jgi:hypothetical protein